MGENCTLSMSSLFSADVIVAVNMLKMVIPIKIQTTANKRPNTEVGVLSPYLVGEIILYLLIKYFIGIMQF